MEAIEQICIHYNSLSIFTMPGHMCTPPPPTHPESPGVLVTCPLLSFPPQSLSQQRNAWCNSLRHAGPSITDPMVRDTVLSRRKGWQINFSTNWWAVMQLSGLVMVQHHAVERPATKNRSQDLRGGASRSSVIMNRVKHCLGCNIIFFQVHSKNRNLLEDGPNI